MKKVLIVFCLALIVTGFAAAGGAGESGGNRTMYVAVRNVELKSGTGALARTVATLEYGAAVTVVQVSGRFMEVRSNTNNSIVGWTAEANLTTRQVVPGTTSTATAREVALAGKGFNKEVEDTFRSQNRNLNYAAVDTVETIRVNTDELIRFLEAGRLAMGD